VRASQIRYHSSVSQQPLDFAPPQRTIFTVSGLLAQVRQRVERDWFDAWIEGEISNLKHSAAGHYYFTLKDASAQLRVVLFAGNARYLKFKLQDGLQVIVRGKLTIYEQRGDLQCSAEYVEPRGRGSLQLAFEQLKARLAAEGLFAEERKRPLPLLPRRVALITSPRGAVIADMVRILRRRYPNLNLLLYPVQVQGEAAAGEICQALAWFAESRAADVLILARGGGSLEDLWPFNEERVARAIVASPIPVISAVGHQTDFTIADFVADLRAPTPSAAAELVVRAKDDYIADIETVRRRLSQALRYRLARQRQVLTELAQHRAFESVRGRIRQRAQRVDELTFHLDSTLRRRLNALRERLVVAATRVRHYDTRANLALIRRNLDNEMSELVTAYRLALVRHRSRLDRQSEVLRERSPLALLHRGYTLVYDADGRIVRRPSELNPGDVMQVRFWEGWLRGNVRERTLEPLPSPVEKADGDS
jgi:exodeoxyribonuclease VII large subunit